MNIPISATIGRRVNSPIGKDRSTTTQQTRNEMNISINNFVRAEHSGAVPGAFGADPLATPENSPLVTEREAGTAVPCELSRAVVLGTDPANSLCVPEPLKSSTFTDESELECEDLCDNVDLKRFRFHNNDKLDLTVDVKFLRHTIKTIITNHNIITTPKDLEDILSYYGEVYVKTDHQRVLTRAPKKSGGCWSSDEIEQFVDTVTKILIGGVNITKKMPAFINFLSELGISF
jgi:hypothetical protein